jgi:UrcA family protein
MIMTYNKILSLSGAAAITLGGLFLVASPASGKAPIVVTAPDDNVVVRRISYADLNLASATGASTLNRRVNGAVSDLCSEATGGDDGSFNFKFNMMKCDGRAWGEARPQIARAVQRARDIASTGASPIAAAAITISLAQ